MAGEEIPAACIEPPADVALTEQALGPLRRSECGIRRLAAICALR
jgi:hypothetical protein